MAKSFEQLAKVLKALGHSARLRIVAGLIKNECNVSQIQQSLQLPQSTVSQHLKILKLLIFNSFWPGPFNGFISVNGF